MEKLKEVGRPIKRVDAADKVTGRAKFTDDLCPKPCLEAKILHSTIGNGRVVSMDTSEALKVPGVVAVFTCFDVPDIVYPVGGHPWYADRWCRRCTPRSERPSPECGRASGRSLRS